MLQFVSHAPMDRARRLLLVVLLYRAFAVWT
jgi:hypothetical protein